MTTLKTFIAALTLVAVAVNPVAASLVPCCCAKKVQPERSCCQATKEAVKQADQVPASVPACCAKKQATSSSVVRSGCCCVKAPPAIPASPDQTKQVIEQPPLQLSCSTVDCIVLAPAVRRFEHLPGSLTISGPPILALYCIWLE